MRGLWARRYSPASHGTLPGGACPCTDDIDVPFAAPRYSCISDTDLRDSDAPDESQ